MDEAELVEALRAGDEKAFVALVERYHSSMVRLASTLLPSRAVAEEAVQDTWLGVVRGIHRFEGRASVRTWLFHILVNRARSAGAREHRSVPADLDRPAVEPGRFGPDGHWSSPPAPWTDEVEERLAAAATVERVRALVDGLPPRQRQVMVLRDVEGLSAQEACTVLGLSEGNQRVLLHRARSSIRRVLSEDLGKE